MWTAMYLAHFLFGTLQGLKSEGLDLVPECFWCSVLQGFFVLFHMGFKKLLCGGAFSEVYLQDAKEAF